MDNENSNNSENKSFHKGNALMDKISAGFEKELEEVSRAPEEKSDFYNLIFLHIDTLHHLYTEKGVSKKKLHSRLNNVIEDLRTEEEIEFKKEKKLSENDSLENNEMWKNRKKVIAVFYTSYSESLFNKYFVEACKEKGLDPKKKAKRKPAKKATEKKA